MITISRYSGYTDKLRAYKVVLDGKVIGEVKDGQKFVFNSLPGKRELFLKIDWCQSNVVEFDGGHDSEFECGSSLCGLKILLAIIYITFFRKRYIWLKEK